MFGRGLLFEREGAIAYFFRKAGTPWGGHRGPLSKYKTEPSVKLPVQESIAVAPNTTEPPVTEEVVK